MAKVKQYGLKISGKLGDNVYVQSLKYGSVVRKAPEKGKRKNEPAFKEQHSRTTILNKLAAELNSIFRDYCKSFKSKNFYHDALKLFRKEALNNRFLLLQQVKGLEINKRYPFNGNTFCTTNVTRSKTAVIVELDVTNIPEKKDISADSYYYEVILLHWMPGKKPGSHSSQLSEWIGFTKERPGFEFVFPVPKGTVHWLLCVRRSMGENRQEIGLYASQGMQIIDAGTFDKKEQKLLEQRMEEKNKRPVAMKVVKERERVKPKRMQ